MNINRLLAFVGGCFFVTSVFAQEAWPTRPVTMVVPFPPGGVADTVGRPVAEALSRSLGQSVVVENKPGAGGGIGMASVAKSKPDGYTILMALSSISIIPEADKVVGREQSFQLNQLKPIARFTADPTVLVVRADSPWKDYKSFIAAMRTNPGKYNFGSSGNYGTMHVPMEMLKASEKFYMVHIPYTGAGPAIVGLLGGQVDAIATGPSSIVQQIKAGKVRALAHWGDGRLASMPEVNFHNGLVCLCRVQHLNTLPISYARQPSRPPLMSGFVRSLTVPVAQFNIWMPLNLKPIGIRSLLKWLTLSERLARSSNEKTIRHP
ncbi:MAG: hypothetical protein RLZZ406_1309 [Pseudomonadota bacterium]